MPHDDKPANDKPENDEPIPAIFATIHHRSPRTRRNHLPRLLSRPRPMLRNVAPSASTARQ